MVGFVKLGTIDAEGTSNKPGSKSLRMNIKRKNSSRDMVGASILNRPPLPTKLELSERHHVGEDYDGLSANLNVPTLLAGSTSSK
jgi:hypothetical protein